MSEKKDFETLVKDVEQWFKDKGIIEKSDPKSQFLKTMSEIGEVADAINQDNKDELIDGIGDVLVTLIGVCMMKNVNIIECLEVAYNVISKRRGKMVNGVFIKDERNYQLN